MNVTPIRPVEITPQAQQNILNCLQKVKELRFKYGEDSEEYKRASWSLIHSLETALSFGGHISAEDELSLYGASFMHFGMIWHRNRSYPDGPDQPGEWSVHS